MTAKTFSSQKSTDLTAFYNQLPSEKLPDIPSYITDNLRHQLRPYQALAIKRFLHYLKHQNSPEFATTNRHLLFQLATGSGKTLIMAALILELYHQGFSNFLFFVNNTNILTKTRDNFANPLSPKYLFKDPIIINSYPVKIRAVQNFPNPFMSSDHHINILFTTIQTLHASLHDPCENQLNFTDFQNQNLILIGDEAHHHNRQTLLSKSELADNQTWELTIQKIRHHTQSSILLEFTATIDFETPSIAQKYLPRTLIRYDLSQFRRDGYSKDILFYEVDSDLSTRILHAIIISEARQYLAHQYQIHLQPIILFKSKTISDNQKNFQLFQTLIKTLSHEKLLALSRTATGVLKTAFTILQANTNNLLDDLKLSFSSEHILLVDGRHSSPETQQQLNSLESATNPYRAIFAVDMLNEGWDVLNLFDIVRLYDTRDAKNNQPGKTTIREAQLIGRGARLFPFLPPANSNPPKTTFNPQKYLRKFDQQTNHPLRLLEQLHYHAALNPQYLQELRQALIATGLLDQNSSEYILTMKPEFQNSHFYQKRLCYRNSLTSQSLTIINTKNLFDFSNTVFKLRSNHTRATSAFLNLHFSSNSSTSSKPPQLHTNILHQIISPHILHFALTKNPFFTFQNLQTIFPDLYSSTDFSKLLQSSQITFSLLQNNQPGQTPDQISLTPAQQLELATQILIAIQTKIVQFTRVTAGSTDFNPYPLTTIFPSQATVKYRPRKDDSEFGTSQVLSRSTNLQLGLGAFDWYPYFDFFGSRLEKLFLKTFASTAPFLEQFFTEFYLFPNPNFLNFYLFQNGQTFTPDFIFFGEKSTPTKKRESCQILIHLIENHSRTEKRSRANFLTELSSLSLSPEIHLRGLHLSTTDFSPKALLDRITSLC